MMNRNMKGLSQVLYLIIAAAVLMMVGMSLVFSFSGSANTSTVDAQACIQSLRAQCTTAPSGQAIDLPSQCTTTDDNNDPILVPGVDEAAAAEIDNINSPPTSTFTCN